MNTQRKMLAEAGWAADIKRTGGNKGMKKKISIALLLIGLLVGMAPQAASASPGLKFSAKTSGMGNVIPVRKVECSEYLEVDFYTDVLWDYAAKVRSVRDNKGKSYKAYLADRDEDDCKIYIPNMKYGRTYRIEIAGLKVLGSAEFKTLTLKVKLPAKGNRLLVKRAEYDVDEDDGRMEWTVKFDFNRDIRHKNNSYVVIRDAAGNAYSSRSSYVEWEEDECEVHLASGLTVGAAYTYEIRKVKAQGPGKYQTIKGRFVAYD